MRLSLSSVLPLFIALSIACDGNHTAHEAHDDKAHHDKHADHAQHAKATHSPASPAEGKPVKGTVEGAKATHLMQSRVRAMPPGSPATGAFFILHNTSEHDAAVIGGSSPAAKTVELHTHVQEDGQFKMRQIDRIDVPAGQQVTLEPGGLHVMLIGPTKDLKVGDTVSLTLDFEGGHSQAFDLPVQEISASGHGSHGGHHHGAKKDEAGANPHAGH